MSVGHPTFNTKTNSSMAAMTVNSWLFWARGWKSVKLIWGCFRKSSHCWPAVTQRLKCSPQTHTARDSLHNPRSLHADSRYLCPSLRTPRTPLTRKYTTKPRRTIWKNTNDQGLLESLLAPQGSCPGYRKEQLHVQPFDWPEGHNVQLEAVLSTIRNRELEQEGEDSQQVGVNIVEGELQDHSMGSAKHMTSLPILFAGIVLPGNPEPGRFCSTCG